MTTMIKCDRCQKDVPATDRHILRMASRGSNKSHDLCVGCASAVVTVLLTPTFETPQMSGENAIVWGGERWERMRETTPVPPPGFEDPPAMASLAHPDELPHDIDDLPADRLLAPSPTGIAQAPVVPTAQRPEARGTTEPGRRGAPQSFLPSEDKRTDRWQLGDKACDVHNCPYRAVEGSTRCKDHIASELVPIRGAAPMAPKVEGMG